MPRVTIARPVCAFDGCNKISVKSCRGWCEKHYRRWYRHGDPSIVKSSHPGPPKDAMETILARTVDQDGCWIWQGATLPNGYGVFGIKGHSRYVHRAAWEWINGRVPAGRELHHICLNRACCNPAHLEALTRREHRAAHREVAA